MRGTLWVFPGQNKGTINLADILATNENVGYDPMLFGKTSVLKCRTSALFVLFELQAGEIKKRQELSPGTQGTNCPFAKTLLVWCGTATQI